MFMSVFVIASGRDLYSYPHPFPFLAFPGFDFLAVYVGDVVTNEGASLTKVNSHTRLTHEAQQCVTDCGMKIDRIGLGEAPL